jgi:hypothetical protein
VNGRLRFTSQLGTRTRPATTAKEQSHRDRPHDIPPTRLHLLFHQHGQSPWLDDLTRGYLTGGQLSRWVSSGIRGVTSNPTIFQRAIA